MLTLLAAYTAEKPGAAKTSENGVHVISGPPKAEDKIVGPVLYWEEVWKTPRPVRLYFLRVDLSNRTYEVATFVSDDPDGAGSAMATLQPPVALATQNGAIAAVNANAFWHLLDAPEAEKKKGWYAGKTVRLFGLAVSDGVLRNPGQDIRTPLWLDAVGRTHVGHPASNDVPQQAVADWEGPLLRDGKIATDDDKTPYPRTLAGTDKEGRYLLLAVADGKQNGVSEGLTLREAAAVMLEHGCSDAVNFDGGGSSVMLVDTKGHLHAVNSPCGGSYLRPIPVMLGIRLRKDKQ